MAEKEILIQKGKTFSLVVRWETEPIIRKAITGISFATGAPRPTVTSHSIPDGWRGAIYGVKGPKQINAQNSPPRSADYETLTVIDSNTLELNGVTPVDDNGADWPAYVSGGFVQFYTPQDLTGYTARIDIRDKIGGTLLLSSEVADSPLNKITATVDTALKTITLVISATDTAALTFKKGVADLEMVSAGGVVTKLKLTQGNAEDPDVVRVVGEVTT